MTAPPDVPRRSRWGFLEWALSVVLGALVIGIVWALVVPAHAAEQNSTSVTGIPVDYLFATIGALGSLVYADLKREVRSLKHEAAKRGRHIRHVENAVRKVCYKLNIKFEEEEDNNDE